MSSYSQNVWKQLKSKTAAALISALLKDGFALDVKVKTERVYWHPDGRRVLIHYHTGSKGYGQNLLKSLLEDAGWSENDMRQLKLIK